MKRLEEDWTEVYGKFRTLQMRVAKQVQRADELAANGSKDEQPGGGEADLHVVQGSGAAAGGRTLSPRQLKIQQQILARRQNMTAQGGE
jgi:hypothetical protein